MFELERENELLGSIIEGIKEAQVGGGGGGSSRGRKKGETAKRDDRIDELKRELAESRRLAQESLAASEALRNKSSELEGVVVEQHDVVSKLKAVSCRGRGGQR